MSQPSETVISARGLARRFGAIEAVRDFDIDIHRGEVFGFLGPNGAGKSTLLRMLVGLLEPSAGGIDVLGFSLPRDAERLRPRLGYMTQRYSLYEDLTVGENLEFAAQVFGVSAAERRRRIPDALAEHGLEACRDQRSGTLSGGWRQRVALAAATIHRPEILLLDEPTAGVDPDRRRAFWQKLFDFAREGTTVLVSTHYMDEAVRCHRLCMMRDGERVALGEPETLVSALTGRILEVTADPLEAVVAALQGRGEVVSATQLGNVVHVLLEGRVADRRSVVEDLTAHLESIDCEAVHLAVGEPTLEDVFVALTLGERLFDHGEVAS